MAADYYFVEAVLVVACRPCFYKLTITLSNLPLLVGAPGVEPGSHAPHACIIAVIRRPESLGAWAMLADCHYPTPRSHRIANPLQINEYRIRTVVRDSLFVDGQSYTLAKDLMHFVHAKSRDFAGNLLYAKGSLTHWRFGRRRTFVVGLYLPRKSFLLPPTSDFFPHRAQIFSPMPNYASEFRERRAAKLPARPKPWRRREHPERSRRITLSFYSIP